MFKKIVVVGIVLSLSGAVRADYVAERRAAVAQGYAGKHVEALTAYTNMAANATSEFQKSDALELAAKCANGLKQYDRALELAKQIPLAAVSKKCRMYLLLRNRKNKELINEFKTEDIEHWPASEGVIGYGLYYRGSAYFKLKNGQAAETDLKKATGYNRDTRIQGRLWCTLGDNYRGNLKDDQKALEAYAPAIKMIRNGTDAYWLLSVISSSAILRKQGKYDKALQMLGKVDMSKIKGVWLSNVLCAYGETLAGQGKKAEALAEFNKALGVKGVSDAQKKNYEKKIKELQGDVK